MKYRLYVCLKGLNRDSVVWFATDYWSVLGLHVTEMRRYYQGTVVMSKSLRAWKECEKQ